MTSEEQEQVI